MLGVRFRVGIPDLRLTVSSSTPGNAPVPCSSGTICPCSFTASDPRRILETPLAIPSDGGDPLPFKVGNLRDVAVEGSLVGVVAPGGVDEDEMADRVCRDGEADSLPGVELRLREEEEKSEVRRFFPPL